MKLLIVILALCLVISPVLASVIEFPEEPIEKETIVPIETIDPKITIEPTETETIVPIETKPIDPIETIIIIEEPMERELEIKQIQYTEKVTLVDIIITKFTELIGLEQETITEEKQEIDVEMDGIIIAIIPRESKFKDMEIHEICLGYQYGTDNWYNCEMTL